MSKRSSIEKAAKGLANDVCDSKKARLNNLKKIGKCSKKKSEKSAADIKKEEESKSLFLSSYKDRQNSLYTTVDTFEDIVYSIEGIRVIVRASKNAKVLSYPYKKKCGGNNTVEYFINKRLKQVTGSKYEFYLPYDCTNETTLAELRKEESKKTKQIDIAFNCTNFESDAVNDKANELLEQFKDIIGGEK